MAVMKLLICYHKKAPLFQDEILTPILVGRAIDRKRLGEDSETWKWFAEHMAGDDTGENISEKNSCYNEMTAVYWAWKNYGALGNPDYIGLMHYRRHFLWDEEQTDVVNVKDFDPDTYCEVLYYDKKRVEAFLEGCDFLPHIGRVQNVYRHYIENQRKEDIDLVNAIVLEKYPSYRTVMKKYYAGDESNFCNMCIFKKELFFSYCEWIFPIMEEFERRQDATEKRFFISERLTGLFVAGLMEQKRLVYKKLPIVFLEEAAQVQIAMHLDGTDMTTPAVTIRSVLKNADGYASYHFYLFCSPELQEETKARFAALSDLYEKCRIDFCGTEVGREFLPLYLPQMLPEVEKCIWISGKTVALKDLGEFYRICSVDDYWISGIPCGKYVPEEREKRVRQELLVLNCRKMRKHVTAERAEEARKKRVADTGIEMMNQICQGEIGYIPWYLYTSERLSGYGEHLCPKEKPRREIQAEALWKPFLIYDATDPVENHQGVYGIFWWDFLRGLPFYFQKLRFDQEALDFRYAAQQKEIDAGFPLAAHRQEDWRSYGLLGKLLFYYKHNGMKQTLRYAAYKIFGRRLVQ